MVSDAYGNAVKVVEPAAHGKPIIVGPHMFNFRDSYALFSDRGACFTVLDSAELFSILSRLLSEPELRDQTGREALGIVNENRGAALRTVNLLKMTLEKRGILD